ncbi:MAG: hypothetical protein KKH28_06020 [Elusimicrobia bacterium]|nr:hypothetical protein [Elusimicrobiota bacterium]
MIKVPGKKSKTTQYVTGGITAVIILLLWLSIPLFLNSFSFAENNRCSGRACSASSQIKIDNSAQDKADDSGKKQSTTKKICSSITNILKGEIGKTKNKTKLDILKGGLKYANEICDAGGAPDLAKITKGLPEKDKKRISQKTSSAMFDGAGDLPDKDFGADSSNPIALTGKGGSVGDLKASGPDINKISPVTEFSLSGTKLSGETPGQAATKQSSILLASAASAKTSADTASASSAKSPAGAASAKTAVSAAAKAAQASTSGNCDSCEPRNSQKCLTICCKEQPEGTDCETLCYNYF